MEEHVRNAVSTNRKQAWGQQIALIVHQTLSQRLAVQQTLRVSVTLVTQGKMEKYVHNAVSTNTRQVWGL